MVDPKIKMLVLDVLKPHLPSLPEFTSFLAEFKGLSRVDVSMVEMNSRTQSLIVNLVGSDLAYNDLKEHIEKQGAVIHSVDRIVVEKKSIPKEK